MNFKTTILLVVLLALVGGYLFVTRDKGEAETKTEEHSLVDVKKDDVSKVVITPADGKQIVLEKSAAKPVTKTMMNATGGADWRLTQPVNALADAAEVTGLLDAVIGLKSAAQTTAGGTGLDKPQFKVEMTAGGKATTLLVGKKLGATGGLYVKVDGKDKAEVVPSDLLTKLDRPASAYRQNKLVEAATSDMQQLQLTLKDGSTITLAKRGIDWEITSPAKIPAESSAVSDILFGITALKATEWVEDPSDAVGLNKPSAVVSFSTQAATTQPTTAAAVATGPAWTTLKFGDFDGWEKKNLYVQLGDTQQIAKVTANSIEKFQPTTLDLRDKRAADVTPANVSRISIVSNVAATTQPTTRPESKTEIVIERKKAPATLPTTAPAVATTGPTTVAATGPATAPATQAVSTQPALPPSKWELKAGGSGDAEELKVTQLLDALHPLRATKYLDPAGPATQPSASYTVSIDAVGAGGAEAASYQIQLIDPGATKPLIGQYNGLRFELDRDILKKLQGDWTNKLAPPEPPPMTSPHGRIPGGPGGPGGFGPPGGE